MKRPVIRVIAAVVWVVALSFCSCDLFPSAEDDANPTDQSDNLINNDDPSDLPDDIDNSANTSAAGVDSMFTLLCKRIESLEDVEGPSDVYAVDFESLRRGFGAAVAASASSVKANVGFIASSILSLNASSSIQALVDSMDSYINAMDNYYSDDESNAPYLEKVLVKRQAASNKPEISNGTLSRAFDKSGVVGLGRVLLAESPKVILAQTGRPSFPRIVTASNIQTIVKGEIIPKLNDVLAATGRLENASSISLLVTMFEDSAEIDKGDIYAFEAGIRLARAMLSMFIIYDLDIYSPDGSSDMRWIDDLMDAYEKMDESYSSITYKLSGDTLYRTHIYDATSYTSPMCDVYAYNLNRANFLTIKNNVFSAVHDDLKAVPTAVKKALAEIRAETDNQNDDIIMRTDILDFDADMADFQADMIEEGMSATLAARFASPETMCDFITEILSQPYTFNETIDSVSVTLKVDLSKFFTNPPTDLRQWFPKHKMLSGADRIQSFSYVYDSWQSGYTETTLYLYPEDYDTIILDIPASAIDTIYDSEYGTRYLELTKGYTTQVNRDSSTMCTPFVFIDDKGANMDYTMFYTMFNDAASFEKAFPYFNDYTFNGIFPDMTTRQLWINLFKPFME